MTYLGIDIGGSWLKAAALNDDFFEGFKKDGACNIQTKKIRSPLQESASINELIDALERLIKGCGIQQNLLGGIGISTAGIVDYAGKKVLKAAAHLTLLKNEEWINNLKEKFNCPVVLINDCDAATIGLAELGKLSGNKTIGIMAIGTGLGFSIWRNGRKWQPGKTLPLLGSIRTASGSFDKIASASGLAAHDHNCELLNVLTDPLYESARTNYLYDLTQIINTASIIYNLDEVMICGGLAEACGVCSFPLGKEINNLLWETPEEREKPVKALVCEEGNMLQLYGALLLAKGEALAQQQRVVKTYEAMETEKPYDKDLQLQDIPGNEIINILWQAEQEAGANLKKALPLLSNICELIFKRINAGGRIIYIGAGTSGRIAAMDAVEIPCTYGFPEDRVVALIAGGIADAAIEIESNFEEDASAVPEMLLLNITSNDVVIGISASGTAYYVQSALAFAKYRGAYTAMIQCDDLNISQPFCDIVVPLYSENEVVAGSTRMKAGTATKKVLNFISSTVMIKMGKVAGPYMVDVACINNKLIKRAVVILNRLYNMDEHEALQKLTEADMKLKNVIVDINKTLNK